jgi:hypothetical protein
MVQTDHHFWSRYHHTRVMDTLVELLAASEHIHTTRVTDTSFGSIVNTSVDGHMLFKRIDTSSENICALAQYNIKEY